MIVRRLGTDWWSRRAELIKSFAGQEVLCLTENFYPPDASLRRTFHHHSTSLCLMMHFVCFYTDAVSENNLWAFPLQCWTWKYPRIAFSDWNACGQQIQREAKDCFQTSSYFQSHLPFFCVKKKITLPDVVILNFIGIVYIYFRQAVQWAVKRATWLGVLGIQELLLGRCDAAVPGAGAVRPLDAGVVVGLASVHLLLDHQVRPQTLLRSGDLTGQRGTAHNLQRHTKQSPFTVCIIYTYKVKLWYHCILYKLLGLSIV